MTFKEKVKSGNYIFINTKTYAKIILDRADLLNTINREIIPIHKRHEKVLDAFIENNNVKIYYESNIYIGELIGGFTEEYDENTQYSLTPIRDAKEEETKECMFKKFGFEVPEFECEIYELKDNFQIIGSVKKCGNWYPISWDKLDGIVYNFNSSNSDDYNLTPIKKPWYEDESNLGKILIYEPTKSFLTLLGIFDSHIEVGTKGYWQHITQDFNNFKLATEEVLSLFKDVK